MYARNLSLYLHQELADFGAYEETQQRFESLRGYGCLPRGRENAGIRLSNEQIANSILGFAPILPGWAGHVALIMGDLRPVGGAKASPASAETLKHAIAILIEEEEPRYLIIHATLCTEKTDTGDEYHARIIWSLGGHRKITSFVSNMAYSLLNSGAETNYDHERPMANSIRQLVLGRKFFQELANEVQLSRELNSPLKTDWREYETEEEIRSFHEQLEQIPFIWNSRSV